MSDLLLALIEEEEQREKDLFDKSTASEETLEKFKSIAEINDEIKPMGQGNTLIYEDEEICDTYELNPSAFQNEDLEYFTSCGQLGSKKGFYYADDHVIEEESMITEPQHLMRRDAHIYMPVKVNCLYG